MVRVLPLIPQLTFDGAGRRRVIHAPTAVMQAGRLPLLEPSRLPPGPEFYALFPSGKSLPTRCPRDSVSGRLVCRVVKSDPILGVTLC
jgi:hypothetical protein